MAICQVSSATTPLNRAKFVTPWTYDLYRNQYRETSERLRVCQMCNSSSSHDRRSSQLTRNYAYREHILKQISRKLSPRNPSLCDTVTFCLLTVRIQSLQIPWARHKKWKVVGEAQTGMVWVWHPPLKTHVDVLPSTCQNQRKWPTRELDRMVRMVKKATLASSLRKCWGA